KLMGKEVEALGFPWLRGQVSKVVGTKALTAHCLCDRHNGLASPLDSLARRAMHIIHDAHNSAIGIPNAAPSAVERQHFIEGDDFERWALKYLCGAVFSSSTCAREGQIKGWKPPVLWQRILYERHPFPTRWGLYLSADMEIVENLGSLGVAAITDPQGRVLG